jgi:hypothetical protein
MTPTIPCIHSCSVVSCNRLKFRKLINGYRQFDPTRGTHYIIDILLIDENKTEYIKRAELMRPLGKTMIELQIGLFIVCQHEQESIR